MPASKTTSPKTVLELHVNNHPGVMSHVCGLFSRRAYNVEGIACLPEGGGETSRIWLLVEDSNRLNQMVTQVTKLQDVHRVNRHPGNHQVFGQLRDIMTS
ncbi:acetolactate synthase small subunit [Desulfovibrio ferrophilus]|uniref:acetolactate synthase n=1 Tax=Desulfovibrio ferrophilus TaxID=241368 RepID=A0A2Z6AVH3_9BACT|nr:acetolactate synthase small subunit [Desulfovibrio ferrophilus]BBD07249.1 amino acid-binding ACT domain-containing protein [Desulfovibrio ferrophilus]